MAMSERRYDTVSSLKAVGIGLIPIALLGVLAFYNPPDCGTRAAKACASASSKSEEQRHLRAAIADFDRFCAFVDSEATNTVAYDIASRNDWTPEDKKASRLFAPHLSIDYSWNEVLENAVLNVDEGAGANVWFEKVFAVPEEKEVRLLLEKDGLDAIKKSYARFRVFPFAPGAWSRWCLLTEVERKASVEGPIFDLAIWAAVVLCLGSVFYFFFVRHWCDKCWRSHWLWNCPYAAQSERRAGLKGLLAVMVAEICIFSFASWRMVDWGNVATLAKTLGKGLGESSGSFCRNSPVLTYGYQLELLDEIGKHYVVHPAFSTGKKSDPQSDFIRIIALNDMFNAEMAPECQK